MPLILQQLCAEKQCNIMRKCYWNVFNSCTGICSAKTTAINFLSIHKGLVFGDFWVACAKAIATHLEAGENHILTSNGDISVSLTAAEVEDCVESQLKLWTCPNERTPYWLHLKKHMYPVYNIITKRLSSQL